MKVLVTGGAGYVGGVSVDAILAAGHEVVVLDDLSTGHAAIVSPAARLVTGSYGDEAATRDLLETERVDAILHCAARSLVGESVLDPAKYYRDNVAGGVALLEAARAAGVRRVVFSSTAAVYGTPDSTPIPEDAPLRPINPYGETKRTFEGALHWYGGAYGLRSRDPPVLQRRGRHGAPGRGPPARDAPGPQHAPGRGGRTRADALRRGLPHPGRHADPRLHPRLGPGRRPRGGARGDGSGTRERARSGRRHGAGRAARSATSARPTASRCGRCSRPRRPSSGGPSRTPWARAGPATRPCSSPPTRGRARSWAGSRGAPPWTR